MTDMTRSLWRRLPDWVKRLSEIGVLPSDSDDLRVRKAVLVLSSTLMASLAFVWVATYAALGLWVSAAIPFAYQAASAASIYTFARTRRYLLFRRSQLWMSLLLPFALQWSLGGFRAGSAVALWAVTAPLGGPPLRRGAAGRPVVCGLRRTGRVFGRSGPSLIRSCA
jgi:adenylate cyclase